MKVDEIVDVVCENRPELKKLFREGADISLYEYYSDTVFVEKSNSKFKKSLINIVKRLAKDREIVIDESVLDQEFSEYFSASTADHHGPLVHSFFYNSTFLETTINDKINKKYIIHLPCAGVSVSNSSYPRGFLFYDEKDHLKKVSLCPISDGRKSIYALKINKKYIEKTLLSLSKDLRSKIEILLPSFSDEKTYEEYITFINFQLWNKITENKQTFITIDQESVVREFLLEHIDADCDIKNLFFKKENLKKYLDIFDGCVGASAILISFCGERWRVVYLAVFNLPTIVPEGNVTKRRFT
jgi:hypothetical protein